jgi:beta-glucosidase
MNDFFQMKNFSKIIVLIMLSVFGIKGLAQEQRILKLYSNRQINFNHPDGAYSNKLLQDDFGNGAYPEGRGFAVIENGVYKITFNKGEKVNKTGAAVQLNILPAKQYTLEYRIKYDANFQPGLHGKQFGFVIGVGYDGGRGEEARIKGNGGSVRLQFDAQDSTISNQLYVYHAGMQGKYGDNPGKQKFYFKKGEWNTIRMTVTMQSSSNVADGKIEILCNGIKKIQVDSMLFVREETASRITKLSFESFPGGGGAVPLYNNYVYVDDVQWYNRTEVRSDGSMMIPIFRDTSLPFAQRVDDLISKLNVEEKISLLGYNSKAIDRLGIPAYNWWNEALHGVGRAGQATVFPQAIALAATFNDNLLLNIADAISTEARAKHNEAVKRNSRLQYMGLTFWSPNINIFRDPRWGRGQETYGEDPHLTATMGTAFVKGLQGNDPKYLKTAACAKHLAVHSGPEALRHSFDARVSEKDLRETYLYAFKRLVNAKVEAVMCAYNRVNGVPCCINNKLINDIVRGEWNFKGHMVSDCWALDDIYKGHKVLSTPEEVTAAAIKAGINVDCSELMQTHALTALKQGLIASGDINAALRPSLTTLFRLGLFDNSNRHPYQLLGAEQVHSPNHVALAKEAALQSMVLLKNDKNLLPLNKGKLRSMVVIGPNAVNLHTLMGNYNGVSGNMQTILEGIVQEAGPAISVQYEAGSDYSDTLRFGGIWAAGFADVVFACLGLNPTLEGEEHDAFLSHGGGDKITLGIPAPHLKLLQQLKANKKPVILILNGGSALDVETLKPYADAILMAWYPGEQGGTAVADILFGKYSPSGRLPVTFYQSLSDLPAYDNYAMEGRTYRYFKGPVSYPFGYGMSYTQFKWEWYKKPLSRYKMADTMKIEITVNNTGIMDGADVLQAYIEYPLAANGPLRELKAFSKVHVPVQATRKAFIEIAISELEKWNDDKQRMEVFPGTYRMLIGNNSRDIIMSQEFTIEK